MGIPIVRITLDSMRHEIAHAFTRYSMEIDTEVQKALEHSVKNFNFQTEVESVATQVLRESIQIAVTDAIRELRNNPEFRAKMSANARGRWVEGTSIYYNEEEDIVG